MLTRDQLISLIDQHNLTEHKDLILKHSKPAIYISREYVSNEDDLPIGASKIGGNPDLPADFVWQVYKGDPLPFLAQIKLSDVKPYDVDDVLPDSGWLYFFWSYYMYESMADRGFLVYFVEDKTTPLQRHRHPVDPNSTFGKSSLSAFKLDFSKLITPSVSYEFLQRLAGDTFFWESDLVSKYYGIEQDVTRLYTPLHYLLGNPFTIQGDLRIEAQKALNGLSIYKKYPDAVYEKLKTGLSDWRLLFQMDTDSVTEADFYLGFGDAGRLYFMIREQDLKAKNFDKVWALEQGS